MEGLASDLLEVAAVEVAAAVLVDAAPVVAPVGDAPGVAVAAAVVESLVKIINVRIVKQIKLHQKFHRN